MSYQAIDQNRDTGAVTTLCRALDVSVSGYYSWCGRGLSRHQQRDAERLDYIRAVQEQGHGLYGSDRIYRALRGQGVVCSRKRIARLMQGLRMKISDKLQSKVIIKGSSEAFSLETALCLILFQDRKRHLP